MSKQYFVLADRECPGWETSSWEEARTYLLELLAKGFSDAFILMPNNQVRLYPFGEDPGVLDEDPPVTF
jgi:hypothetical protein